MSGTPREQMLAFVGVAQVGSLVDGVANGRPVSVDGEQAVIAAIFETHPESVDSLFGDLGRYRTGIATARGLLSRPDHSQVEPIRYTMALVDISRRLRANPGTTRQLGDLIEELAPVWRTLPHDELFEKVAAIYQKTISTLERRIHVHGVGDLLQRPAVANHIRTLLLAGVRFAWLWHQMGGRRWHLVLRRSTMRRIVDQLHQPTTH